jgi:hypothetical protein
VNRTRRLVTGCSAGLAVVSLGLFFGPTADAAPAADALPSEVTASEWACLAVGEIDVGLCIDDPVPDTSGLPTVPEILDDVLGLLEQR